MDWPFTLGKGRRGVLERAMLFDGGFGWRWQKEGGTVPWQEVRFSVNKELLREYLNDLKASILIQ